MNLNLLETLRQGAAILQRPDIAVVVQSFLGQLSSVEDHDFKGAPRTKAWVEARQPTFSPDADFINELVTWAVSLERELRALTDEPKEG